MTTIDLLENHGVTRNSSSLRSQSRRINLFINGGGK